MAAPRFDRDKAAKILVDASTMGDAAAALKWGIAAETISRYRRKLESDPELSKEIKAKKRLQDQAWADDIPAALTAAIDYLKRASQDADTRDPDAIHAVAGAAKILSEIAITREVIDARLAEQD
jgi:hypothetical protein